MRRTFAAILIALLTSVGAQAQFSSVEVQVIDRGQADGILIRTPNSQWFVTDAGADNMQADAMQKAWISIRFMRDTHLR